MPRIPKVIATRGRAALGRAVVDALHAVPKLTRNMPHARRRREGLTIWEDVDYVGTGLPAHRLDVFRLSDAPPEQRALMYVHGGGFSACSKDTHIGLAVAFARRGFTVFNINYRLAPRNPYPAACEDVAAALLYVRRRASEYGASGEQVTLAGESAGANLITSTALAHGYELDLPWARDVRRDGPAINAVLAGCGVYQVSDMARFFRDGGQPPGRFVPGIAKAMELAYLGTVGLSAGERVLADPVVLVERHAPTRPLPPFFIFCGTGDLLLDDSVRLKAALDQRSVAAELRTYEGEPHAFHALRSRPAAVACWKDHDRFLEQHLGQAGTAPR
ncbi:MAG: alpha/beta hydrolase [Sandaracinaceae bacterium]|nr:alpha/beta hydrolase [Sandaracinaceae bacterium]